MGMENQTESPTSPQEGAQPPQTTSVSHLQRKLKDAAKKILSLLLEREQLLEMGNRLRAEQGQAKGKCLEQDGKPGQLGSCQWGGKVVPWFCHRRPREKAFWLACYKPGARGRAAGWLPREAGGQRPLVVEWSQPDALGTEQGFISALGVP